MSKISVISYDNNCFEHKSECVAGCEIIYSGPQISRRKLRRFISRYGIDRAVVSGDVPDFVLPELLRAGVSLCTGERLMRCIYPKLISRAAKLYKTCDSCTVYDESADDETLRIIECAAMHFKNVALCTQAESTHIAEQVMSSIGLALKLGECEGVGIVYRGKGGTQKVNVDLTSGSTTVFADENNSIITPSVAEAIAGEDIDLHVLERLKLKIYSLC